MTLADMGPWNVHIITYMLRIWAMAIPSGCLATQMVLKGLSAEHILQARTYPDLLKSPHDEELMQYYCMSSLVYIKVWFCPPV